MGQVTERVLVVDDELTIRNVLQRKLQSKGFDTEAVESAEAAIDFVRDHSPAVVLCDIVLPGMNGLQALAEIKKISHHSEVLIMTSHASLETAIQAIREGAYDYLQKPFEDLDQVWLAVKRAFEKRALTLSNRHLLREQARRNQELADSVARLTTMVNASHAMSDLDSLAELLDYFVEFLTSELDVDRASLMLLDEEAKALRIAAHRGIDDVDSETVLLPLGKGVAGRVAESGEAVLVRDTAESPGSLTSGDLSDSFVSTPIVLSIPLKSSRRVLGVVNLTNRRSGEPFGDDDLKFVQTLSNHLAVAIEKNKHLDELKQAYDSLTSTQDQLVFSERLKVVGQMAAGVAHDFNNLLSVISGKAELQLSRFEAGPADAETAIESLRTITQAALQGSRIVDRIQNYTRTRGLTKHRVFDVNEAVRDAIEMTRPKWKDEPEADGYEVRMETRLGENLNVSGNIHELTQAVANLIFNAVEAMPEGGSLRLRSREDGTWIVVEVEDTGTGMDEETQSRLFEPFFTTKQDGQGLGTSILNGIVRRHDGRIRVRSKKGEGSSFELCLPIASDQPEPAAVEVPIHENFRQARVLLVDDEDLVRQTFEEILRAAGHQVVPCSSGRQALQLFRKMECDAVITDLGMPDMSGLELARELKALDCELPIILISGWGGEFIDDKVENVAIDFVLEKPCMIETLLRTLSQALDQLTPA